MLYLLVDGHAVSLPGLVILGAFVGVVAGMFSVGGGFLLTPALHLFFGISMPSAVGISLSQNVGTAIGGFLKHRQYGRGEPLMDLYMLGGALMGSHAGVRTLTALEAAGPVTVLGKDFAVVQLVLQILFIVFLLVTVLPIAWALLSAKAPREPGTGFLLRVKLPPYTDLPRIGLRRISVPVLASVGFISGFASGLLGVGGGIILLPIFLFGLGMTLHQAAGTGLVLLLVNVLWGTLNHALHGTIALNATMAILAGSTIGAQIGARTTHRLSPARLQLGFVGLVVLTVTAIVIDLIFN